MAGTNRATTPAVSAESPARRPSAVRTRILSAARRRFYADGIRPISADRLIADAEVSKMTFYRHFRSKDELVLAYLSEVVDEERAALAAARAAHADDPAAVLEAYADGIGRLTCSEGFRGCAFLNAAAEHADQLHPVRGLVNEHRAWLRSQFIDLLSALGVPSEQTSQVADQLHMLRDGAMIAGSLDRRAEDTSACLKAAGSTIVRAALTHPDRADA